MVSCPVQSSQVLSESTLTGVYVGVQLTSEPKEAELRSKLLQLSSSSTNQIGLAEAHNALAELYYGLCVLSRCSHTVRVLFSCCFALFFCCAHTTLT